MGGGRLLIAVVDDEDGVRKAVAALLRSVGMEVAHFASGGEFLLAVRDRDFDCLVHDLPMPSMDGFEVQEKLALEDIRLPVVVITGNDSPGYRERALAAGAAAY